jgi:hypothetical protein
MRCGRGFETFALLLHQEKTRLIEFGHLTATDREMRGLGKPETFKFLGFTFICGKSRKDRFLIHRETRRDRMRAKLEEVKEQLQPAPAPSDTRAKEMAAAGRDGTLRLLRGPDKRPGAASVPASRGRPMAMPTSAAQPEGRHELGAHDEARRRLAFQIAHHPRPSQRFAVTHPR